MHDGTLIIYLNTRRVLKTQISETAVWKVLTSGRQPRLPRLSGQLRHWKAQAIAGRPDASSQQFDHVGIVGGRVAGDPRSARRPVGIRPGFDARFLRMP